MPPSICFPPGSSSQNPYPKFLTIQALSGFVPGTEPFILLVICQLIHGLKEEVSSIHGPIQFQGVVYLKVAEVFKGANSQPATFCRRPSPWRPCQPKAHPACA